MILNQILRKLLNSRKYPSFKQIGINFIWNSGLVSNPENIIIGDHVYIGPGAHLYGSGGITIESGTIIGPRVTIHTANHNYENATHLPYDGKVILKKVTIKENVWIGDSVSIVPGITIGEGSIIGLGSVVTKNIDPFSIVGGNPAKLIRRRNDISQYLTLKDKKNIYLKDKLNKKIIIHYEREGS